MIATAPENPDPKKNAKKEPVSLGNLEEFMIPLERKLLGILLCYTPHKQKKEAMTQFFEAIELSSRGYSPEEVSEQLLQEILDLLKT
jgi:hypothetical protein